MRVFLGMMLAFVIVSCSDNGAQNDDPYVVESEIIESNLGSKEVYGVRLRLKSPQNIEELKGYQVSFYQDNKVWIDTVFAELNPNDTLESELIFTQSEVNTESNISFKLQSFNIGS